MWFTILSAEQYSAICVNNPYSEKKNKKYYDSCLGMRRREKN